MVSKGVKKYMDFIYIMNNVLVVNKLLDYQIDTVPCNQPLGNPSTVK